MKQEEARPAILAEWRRWWPTTGKSVPGGLDGLSFFSHLQKDRPDLLSFRGSGDKWQIVHGWLMRANLVPD
jgi:hypothetical protein